MGVKKTMDIFLEGMQNNNQAGYSGKILNTPMGPFKWDDLHESWVNMNNGFRMPNFSMQDMLYGSDGAGNGGESEELPPAPILVCDYSVIPLNGGSRLNTRVNMSDLTQYIPSSTYTLSGFDCNVYITAKLIVGLTGVKSLNSLPGLTLEYTTTGGSTWAYLRDESSILWTAPNETIGPSGNFIIRASMLAGSTSLGGTTGSTYANFNLYLNNSSNSGATVAHMSVSIYSTASIAPE
jgi:hypothetical protein